MRQLFKVTGYEVEIIRIQKINYVETLNDPWEIYGTPEIVIVNFMASIMGKPGIEFHSLKFERV